MSGKKFTVQDYKKHLSPFALKVFNTLITWKNDVGNNNTIEKPNYIKLQSQYKNKNNSGPQNAILDSPSSTSIKAKPATPRRSLSNLVRVYQRHAYIGVAVRRSHVVQHYLEMKEIYERAVKDAQERSWKEFNDSFARPSEKSENDRNFNDYSHITLIHINEPHSISTSSDLLLSINNDINEKITCTPQASTVLEKNAGLLTSSDLKAYTSENNVNTEHCVEWNNLFDNSFFDNLDDSPISNLEPNSINIPNINSTVHDICVKTPQSNEFNQLNKTEKRKTATEISKTTMVKNAKNNKCADQIVKKSMFRKEKYTKSVKNWLNSIDTKSYRDTVKESCSNEKNESKKIVQARLTNIGGVMKFAKPKVELSIAANVDDCNNGRNGNELLDYETVKNFANLQRCGSTDIDVVHREELSHQPESYKYSTKVESIGKIKKFKLKDNRAKSKFTNPTRSLLPVQNLKYSVHILDELNIEEYSNTLNLLDNNEVVMVLMYSNDFNQLNAQFSSVARSPIGVMFSIYEHYYYVNKFQKPFTELICNVISTNSLICFNAKVLLVFLLSHCDISRCLVSLNLVDVKIGANLLKPEDSPETFSEVQKLLDRTPSFTIATDCALQKCAWYMSLLRECASSIRVLLADGGLWKLFTDIEMRVVPVIAEMEDRGVCVDLEYLKSMESTIMNHMKQVEVRCYEAAGRNFQINSAPQVRSILYDELHLDARCNVKIRQTICKAKSTSEAMLRSLTSEHPLPKLILEYRHLHKAHATFLAGMLPHVRDGVVKPTWDQNAAVTGRMACNNPNMQAIPKAPFNLVLYPEGDQKKDVVVNFRDAYVARAGRTLLAADFKHAECRVLALAAADELLQGALLSTDLFRVLASSWLKKPEETVTDEERERTKRIVYASLYGAGPRRLSDLLQVSYDQALEVLASFNRAFPSLKSFGRSVVARCEQCVGRLSTPSGRSRNLQDILSENAALKGHAQRQAVNFIVQGSAADLCKAAMVATTEQLRGCAPPVDARLLLQIHDELVWEVLDDDLPRAADVVRAAMERCGDRCGLAALFPAGLSAGPRWGSMQPYPPRPLNVTPASRQGSIWSTSGDLPDKSV